MLGGRLISVAVSCALLWGCAAEEKTEKKDLKPVLLAATDAREAENSVFGQALEAGDWSALSLLGQVGNSGCGTLVDYLSHEDASARAAARLGAAYCYGEAVTDALKVQLDAAVGGTERDELLIALGFSGDESVTPLLVENFDPQNMASVYAFMQNVVYKRLPAAEQQGLPFDAILAATSDQKVGFVNAYLLTRLQGLEQVYSLADMVAAIKSINDQDTQKHLVRTLPQFGDAASATLLEIASGETGPARLEAVRAMGQLGDEASKAYLIGLLDGEDTIERSLAVAAFASRDLEDSALTERLLAEAGAEDQGVAATAFGAYAARAEEEATARAESMLGADSYYLAFKGINILAGTDEGKKILESYGATHPDTQRGQDARSALDPFGAASSKVRATPSQETLEAYRGKQLKLSTSRGDIVISMLEDTPYTATNFLQLAESGKMDGMLWHRVIPNFVAQAGQIEDLSLNDWGNIREEWVASGHKIGTVGVATLGKDTGSTQFFINTAYNLHLNGRYTVFGTVTEGLDIAMALREGDVIEKAEVLAAN